jgi:hypothetical protein
MAKWLFVVRRLSNSLLQPQRYHPISAAPLDTSIATIPARPYAIDIKHQLVEIFQQGPIETTRFLHAVASHSLETRLECHGKSIIKDPTAHACSTLQGSRKTPVQTHCPTKMI